MTYFERIKELTKSFPVEIADFSAPRDPASMPTSSTVNPMIWLLEIRGSAHSSKSSKQSLIQLARDLTSLSLKKKIIERI